MYEYVQYMDYILIRELEENVNSGCLLILKVCAEISNTIMTAVW